MSGIIGHTQQPLERLKVLIDEAKEAKNPLSRRFLVSLIAREYDMEPAEAEALVDRYCAEKAPYVPEYLTREFMLPYIRLASVVVVGLSIAMMGYGLHLMLASRPYRVLFALAAILFVSSGIGFLKILAMERDLQPNDRSR